MITAITADNLREIKNAGLRKDAGRYADMYERFMDSFRNFGLQIAGKDYSAERSEIIGELKALGVKPRNHGRSFLWGNKISAACEDCVKGEQTRTFILTLACNRDCFPLPIIIKPKIKT
jgi:hypothetical protein